MSAYTQSRAQVLTLSTQLSNELAKYSILASDFSNADSTQELQLKNKIESLLSQLSVSINEMSRILESMNSESVSSSKYQQLARHREELKRHRQDFQRITAQLVHERDRENLLSNVRSDIDQYNESNLTQSAENYMLDERLRVDRQNNIVDSLISQVLETRDEIMRQRNVFTTISNRLDSSLSTVPGLNVLLNKIDSRHRKQAIILTVVILICLIILWFSL